MKPNKFLGLDVGSQRIGVAVADSVGRIAVPLTTLTVDGLEMVRLQTVILEQEVNELIVGLPRNQAGIETAQSEYVRKFADTRLRAFDLPIVFQDESVTSVIAEERLKARNKPYDKAAVDAEAAAIILQDYLETPNG